MLYLLQNLLYKMSVELTFEKFSAQVIPLWEKFSKASFLVISYSKLSTQLTFEKLCVPVLPSLHFLCGPVYVRVSASVMCLMCYVSLRVCTTRGQKSLMCYVTFEWVTPHINESRHIQRSHVTHNWVTSHIKESRNTLITARMNESRHTFMNHVTFKCINESCDK